MVAFNKFNQFVEDLAHGVHDLETDQLALALCAAANAPVAGNSVLGDLVQISYANLSSRNLTVVSSGQVGGTFTLVMQDLILTASGGAVATFRYVSIYNDTPTTPADPLLGWYDYGGDVTLLENETLTVDFDATFITLV